MSRTTNEASLELINNMFDNLQPGEREQFVIRALDDLGVHAVSVVQIMGWRIAYEAVCQLSRIRDCH